MHRISPAAFAFICGLLTLLGLYAFFNAGANVGSLSSDVWSYQMLEIQKRTGTWTEIPPSYNQSEWYVAFPLFYYLNPGLEGSIVPYHILAAVLIALTYLLSGGVIYRIFASWWLAAFGAMLVIIPRYAFPTQIGLLSLDQVRASALMYPLFFLVAYYWVLYGISDYRKNITLGAMAGASVYLYPPTAITTALFSVGAALCMYGTSHARRIAVFCASFMIVAFPFVLNHVLNVNTGMTDAAATDPVSMAMQLRALERAFAGNIRAFSVEFEEMKRIVWDQVPMLLIFALSYVLVRIYRGRIPEEYGHVSRLSAYLLAGMLSFVGFFEVANWLATSRGGLPVFIEHLRILRGVGFVTAMQAVVSVAIVSVVIPWRWLAPTAAIALLVSPVFFMAPTLRQVVRAIVPDGVRSRYNLAPVVGPESVRSFSQLEEVSLWAKASLPDGSVVFVFNDFQREFLFKVMSRHDTTSTEKEGNIWVTSGEANSMKWISERLRYDEAVTSGNTFDDIAAFAREIGATHMLLPPGRYTTLYELSPGSARTLFQNDEFRLLEI